MKRFEVNHYVNSIYFAASHDRDDIDDLGFCLANSEKLTKDDEGQTVELIRFEWVRKTPKVCRCWYIMEAEILVANIHTFVIKDLATGKVETLDDRKDWFFAHHK